MPTEIPPPIEWVRGTRGWWVFRYVPATILGIIILGLLLDVVLFSRTYWTTSPGFFYFYGIIASGFAIEAVLLSIFPSVRRIGLSPLGFTVDWGIRRVTYPWPRVSEIVRTSTSRYRGSVFRSVGRTRVKVDGTLGSIYTLTEEQGDSLAGFLHLRSSPGE